MNKQYFRFKTSILFLLLITLSIPLLASRNSELWQQVENKRVTINVVNRSLDFILSQISKQTDLEYGYKSGNKVSNKDVFSINVNNETVLITLEKLLKNSNYTFEASDSKILIVHKSTDPKGQINEEKKVRKTAFAKTVINSQTKEPIVGATVIIVKTNAGAITDRSGKFFLIADEGSEYQVTFVGMKMFKGVISFNDKNKVIELQPDLLAVDDVVVTGYQTLSSRELASSVTTLKGKDINLVGVSSIDQMLQGKVAGMMIMNTSGEPSATPKIRIRGNSTLSGNKAPVWVLDGVILEQTVPFDASNINGDDAAYLIGNAIGGINPNDIETITVLKDASATAIYGIKAANGVIVVTTKKGTIGRPVVTYSGGITVGQRPSYNNFDRMTASERMQLSKDIYDTKLTYPSPPTGHSYEWLLDRLHKKEISQTQFDAEVLKMQNRNVNWFDELYRTTVNQTHSLNVSGGTDRIRYYTSMGYNKDLGSATGSSLERFTSLSKINVSLNDYIDFNAQINFSTTANEGFHSSVNPFDFAYNTSRTLSPYNDDGSLNYTVEKTLFSSYSHNIINELNTTGYKSKNDQFSAILGLNIKLLKGLSYSGTFSYSINNTKTEKYATEKSDYVGRIREYDYNAWQETDSKYKNSVIPYGGIFDEGITRGDNYTIRNTLIYDQDFGKHGINIMGGIEARSANYDGISLTAYGWKPEFGNQYSPVVTDKYISKIIKNGLHMPKNTNSITQVASFFGTASYTYDNKYILNANIRSDGANKFGSNPKYRWLPTWSVAAKWIISGEKFMVNQSWANLIALRASYGVQGNIHDDSTPYLLANIDKRDPVVGHDEFTINKLPNPDLRWEKTKSWNVALDFTLFDARVRGSFDFYEKYTSDLITERVVSASNGVSSVSINAGEMMNRGIEGNINVDVIRGKSFDWRLGVTLGRNINKVTLANEDSYDEVERIGLLLNGEIAVEGTAVGSIYAYDYVGLSKENGYPFFRAKDGRLVHEGDPGLLGLVNVGSKFPTLSGGFQTQFTYKKILTLTMNFTYNIGGVNRLPSVYENSYSTFDPLANLSNKISNRWKKPGDEMHTDIPALVDSRIIIPNELDASRPGVASKKYTTLYNDSDALTVKSDYLRLSSVSLLYTLPYKLLSKIKISRMDIRLQATNLALWASDEWGGLDPEMPLANIPLLPTFSLGVNISF